MKKIFVYIGSERGNKSTTYAYLCAIVNRVIELMKTKEIRVFLHTADNCKINRCKGCMNCFINGYCVQDKNDEMEKIRDEMLTSDFIILASPVYFHNVSGDMKIFIDRITYWSHLLRLAGKAGISVVTSTGNGLDITTNYLNKVMLYMGIKVIDNFVAFNGQTEEDIVNSVENTAYIVSSYLLGNENKTSDDQLELIFDFAKNFIEKQREFNTAEYKYWNESGMLKCNNFNELLNIINK